MSQVTYQSRCIRELSLMLEALEKFRCHEGCVFNATKLARQLGLSQDGLEDYLKIIFRFQDLFLHSLNGKELKTSWRNDSIYIRLEPLSEDCNSRNKNKKIIEITEEQANMLCDIIHYFLHVCRGKGFDLVRNGSRFTENIKEVHRSHPYLFEKNGNGFMYPSELALEFGKVMFSYNRINKPLNCVEIDDYNIIIKGE